MLDLQGKKTYIVAVVAAAATLLKYLGYLTDDGYQMIMGLLGAGGIATLAAKSNRIDKKLIIFIFAIIFSSATYAQTPTYFTWDYPDVDITNVVKFQVKVNTGSYIDVGIPNQELLADTTPANHTYRWTIPATLTQATLSVRACNSLECSVDASTSFKLIGPPGNPRIKK